MLILSVGAGGTLASDNNAYEEVTGVFNRGGFIGSAIDTTQANTICLTGEMSVANAGNKFYGVMFTVDIYG